MPEVKWIKLSTGIFNTSRKIKQIEAMSKGDTVLIIWFKLMILAGTINDGGAIYVTPNVPYTDKGLAEELRRPLAIVKEALATFETYGMITRKDGIIQLSSWDRYQSTERLEELKEYDRKEYDRKEYNRLAQQRHRAQKKTNNVIDNVIDMSLTCQEKNSNMSMTCQEKNDNLSMTCQEKNDNLSAMSNDRERKKSIDIDNTISLYNAREDVNKDVKLTYVCGKLGGGVVFLSSAQIDDLLDKLSLDEFERYIGVVRDEELRGHRYGKPHYQAILDMAAQDRKTKPGKMQSQTKPKSKSYDTDDFFAASLARSYEHIDNEILLAADQVQTRGGGEL